MKDIKDLTNALLGNIKQKEKDRHGRWEELMVIVEDEWKDKIINLGYSRGRILIGVTSSVSCQEITQFHKSVWIERLKKAESKIKDIKIKLIDELGEHSE